MRGNIGPVEALSAALRDLNEVEVTRIHQRDSHTRIRINVGGRRYEIDAVWAGNGWPSEIRDALASLPRSRPANLVITAKRFSPGALRMLAQADANWADASGQARIVLAPGLLLARESRTGTDDEGPQSVRWPRSAVEIAEFILHEGPDQLRTGPLAAQIGRSAAQVSKVLKMFDGLGWTEQHGGKSGRATRRELVAPGSLLDSWAEHVGGEARRKRLGHTTSRDLLRFAHTQLWDRFGRDDQTWALTTWAGLQMTTPFTTLVPALHIYVSADVFARKVSNAMRAAGIREVDEGARVEFWEADFKIVTQRGEPSEIPVISRPRLYADLLSLGGRGADSAQHYRETALGI